MSQQKAKEEQPVKEGEKNDESTRRQSISKSGKSKPLTKSPPMDEEPVGEP